MVGSRQEADDERHSLPVKVDQQEDCSLGCVDQSGT
jgi:hypothetical protein